MELRSKFYKYTGKRIFDVFSSVIILLVLLPIIIIIAILIKFDSEGPIFFFQERVGYKNKLFIIWKFRTMIVDSSKYSLSPDSTDDPRITKMGRHLRKTGLDEIPQLFNVLMGKMSLVGPRPEMPFLVNEYSDDDDKMGSEGEEISGWIGEPVAPLLPPCWFPFVCPNVCWPSVR